MPTLNYENAGALVEYDYLQGTVIALYPEDDTADVSGVCGSLSKIPIFYHCKPDSVARDNGALTGATGGFKVGDSVVVLKSSGGASSSLYNLDKIELEGSSSTATGPKYFVVGHYDGVKKCATGQVLIYGVRPSYGTVWLFVWDLATDDYATGVTAQYNRTIQKFEYPWDTQNQPDVLSAWKSSRFASISGIASFVDETINLFIDDDVSFGQARLGDYVYVTNKPWIWSKIQAVAGGIIVTEDKVLDSNNWSYTVSSSLPLYVQSKGWVYDKGLLTPEEDPEDYNAGDWSCYFLYPSGVESANYYSWTGHKARGGTYRDYVLNTSANLSPSQESFGEYSVEYSGPEWPECLPSHQGMTGILRKYYIGQSIYEYALNIIRGNLDIVYVRDYKETYALLSNLLSGAPYTESKTKDTLNTYGASGIMNPLSNTLWEWSIFNHYLPTPTSYSYAGDIIRPTGEMAICTDNFCFQFYTYPGYEMNTVGQCVQRPSPASPPGTLRSSKLEQAIKDLVAAIVEQTSAVSANIDVWGIYYTSNRDSTGGTMLQLINAARGSDNLREDAELMGQCESHAAICVSSGVSQHTSDGVNEVISVHVDTDSLSKVVQDWMGSPLHKTAIYGGAFGVSGTTRFGWAEGVYPVSVLQITIAAGTYNPGTGGYSEGETVYDVPVDLRGKIKFYIVQIAR